MIIYSLLVHHLHFRPSIIHFYFSLDIKNSEEQLCYSECIKLCYVNTKTFKIAKNKYVAGFLENFSSF